jgi:hypothetical protein
MNTQWGVDNIQSVLSKTPDLDFAIVAFGMNDAGLNGGAYVEQINQIVSAIQAKNPTTDILLIGSMLPNPDSFVWQNQVGFVDYLLTNCEREGVAVADVTHVHEYLLTKKAYSDMTGNNINHPNDYLARVYAQTLLKTLRDKDKAPSDGLENQAGKGGCSSTASLSGAGIALSIALAATAKKRRK